MELSKPIHPDDGMDGDDWTPLLMRAPNADPLYNKRSKRLLDVVGALALLVLAGPLMLLIAALIRAGGGPAVFRHRRIGARGRPFLCLKFRTMHVDAREMLRRHLEADPAARAEWNASFKLKDDPRITRLGRFLRRTSLDELPQVFNVLAGDMSVVGPRPIVPEEIDRYGGLFGFYAYCRPGLTGIWQISGRSDVDYHQRIAFDRQYVARWSLFLDLRIILSTPKVFLVRSGAY